MSFDKALYWERRKKGLRGQTGYAKVVQTVETEDGTEIVPVSAKLPPPSSHAKTSSSKLVDRRFTKPNHGKFVRQRAISSGNARES